MDRKCVDVAPTLVQRREPEPIEEKPVEGYEGPKRGAQQFINASNSDAQEGGMRNHGVFYRKSGRFSPRRLPEF
jgi:hypothetical protein